MQSQQITAHRTCLRISCWELHNWLVCDKSNDDNSKSFCLLHPLVCFCFRIILEIGQKRQQRPSRCRGAPFNAIRGSNSRPPCPAQSPVLAMQGGSLHHPEQDRRLLGQNGGRSSRRGINLFKCWWLLRQSQNCKALFPFPPNCKFLHVNLLTTLSNCYENLHTD